MARERVRGKVSVDETQTSDCAHMYENVLYYYIR